jgi:hypothetical protein
MTVLVTLAAAAAIAEDATAVDIRAAMTVARARRLHLLLVECIRGSSSIPHP